MQDYTETVTIYDVNNSSFVENVKMVYDPERKMYIPVNLKSANGFWCGLSCGLGTIAIAASDGPTPLMDILAAS